MQLSGLRDVLPRDTRGGTGQAKPIATIHLDARHGDGVEKQALRLRWQHLRERLQSLGAPRPVVDALEEAALRAPHGNDHGGRLACAVPADGGAEVLLDVDLTGAPGRDGAWWGREAQVWPLIEERCWQPAHLLVRIDRLGGSVSGEDQEGRPVQVEVEGEDLHVHKVPTGDWAHPQFQRRSENRWRDNVDAVLDVVTTLDRKLGRPVVGLSGDVRARQIFRDRAPVALRPRLVDLDGAGRAPGADHESTAGSMRKVAELSAMRAVRDQVARFERIRAQEGGEAVMGAGPVAELLDRGQVEVLLVDRSAGVAATLHGLVHRAAATDTEVVAVPDSMVHLKDGVGAILRYRLTDRPTPSPTASPTASEEQA